MDASPVITEAGGYNQGSPVKDTDEDDEEDLCRICQSPEEPGNPLRYPCACRGSIKYVHQDCLRLWLNSRGYKNCEVCGRSYSFVPVYSKNAPERLPCHEFLLGLLLRVLRYVKFIMPSIVVILFNTYFNSLHPWGQEVVVVLQRDYNMSWKFASLGAGLFYSFWICFMAIIIFLMVVAGSLIDRRYTEWFIFVGNGLGQEVIAGVVKALWKYMQILSIWCLCKSVQLFHLREPLGLVNRDLNVPLDEFGAIRKMLSFLDDDAFSALAISIYMSVLFVLLPFSVGWIVLATVGSSYLSGNSPVFLGYMTMLSISFAYLGILFLLHPNLVRWFSMGWAFTVKTYKNLSIIKDGFVLYLKLGVLPWLIGCWLKISTSPIFGTTISRRFEILSHFPSPMTLQWWTGFMCLLIASNCMEYIQQIIHKRAFWYLINITDPNYKITKLNLGYTFFSFASHGILLAILFHLPIQTITFISPSFFPLELWVTEEKPTIGAYILSCFLIASNSPWLIKLIEPASELIVRNWIITVSSWLHLSDFLLTVPQGEGSLPADQNADDDNPWYDLYQIAEGSMVTLHNLEDDIKDQGDNRFVMPRVALMLVLAVLSMFFLSTTFMALPVLVGRVFFCYTSFITLRLGFKHDDLCAFLIGCYILRGVYIRTCFVSDHIQKGKTKLLIKYISLWIQKGLLFSIWISIIPGLLGLLIDLTMIIPSRVPLEASPVFFLIEDWLTGVIVLHIWTFLTMLTPINCFASEAWLGKFERIRNVGINRLPSMWLLCDVIGSIVNTLLTTLCFPYLLAKSLFPLLGFSQSVNLAIERFIWPALLALVAVWFIAKLTRELIVYLHQLIFDDLYVIGQRVNDLTEDLSQGLASGV